MVDEPDGDLDDRPQRDRAAVDAALAEFTALRTELISHSAAQNGLVGFGLTAIGVVVGVAFGASDQRQLLTVVPLVASMINVAYAGEAFRVIAIGRYIRDRLWPFLKHRSRADLPSWEAHLRDPARAPKSVVEIPVVGLFGLIGLGGAALADGVPVPVRACLGVLVLASVVFGAIVMRRL